MNLILTHFGRCRLGSLDNPRQPKLCKSSCRGRFESVARCRHSPACLPLILTVSSTRPPLHPMYNPQSFTDCRRLVPAVTATTDAWVDQFWLCFQGRSLCPWQPVIGREKCFVYSVYMNDTTYERSRRRRPRHRSRQIQ